MRASFLIDFSFTKSNSPITFLLQFYAFLKTRTCVNSKLYPLKSAGASRSGPVTTCPSRDPAGQSQGRVSAARTNHRPETGPKRRYLTKVATIYEIMLVLNTTVQGVDKKYNIFHSKNVMLLLHGFMMADFSSD